MLPQLLLCAVIMESPPRDGRDMGANDFDVIAYKVLRYAYECVQRGVEPSWSKAQELAGCNPVYFRTVVQSMSDSGYLAKCKVSRYDPDHGLAFIGDLSITYEGTVFLDENDRFHAVRKFLGRAFDVVIAAAVESTIALGIGGV